jgi:hypothetical protein
MYNNLANAVKDGFFVNTIKYKEIFDALKVTSYIINSQGKKALVPKEEIKAIIGQSPDALDSLALSFYGSHDAIEIKVTPELQQQLINTLFR